MKEFYDYLQRLPNRRAVDIVCAHPDHLRGRNLRNLTASGRFDKGFIFKFGFFFVHELYRTNTDLTCELPNQSKAYSLPGMIPFLGILALLLRLLIFRKSSDAQNIEKASLD